MNRLGFAPHAYRSAWLRLSGLTQVENITLMTHLSDADGTRGIAHQLAAFELATLDLPGDRSVANSAGTLRFASHEPRVRADWGAARDHGLRLVRPTSPSTTSRTGASNRR